VTIAGEVDALASAYNIEAVATVDVITVNLD
jgi:hypothetical protein